MIIQIAQQLFCRLQDKNLATDAEIGQKRTANGRRPTKIRQRFEPRIDANEKRTFRVNIARQLPDFFAFHLCFVLSASICGYSLRVHSRLGFLNSRLLLPRFSLA